ncbi:PAS domain-containing protein [Scytonema sp. UIC 10036]|uniref:PAS domain-containing protein n=1 Tax=Scytonema sp. UIC 10036 TaxID=2304196 RepID=UPI0012DA16C9|nr:PAS domain-containing protein [Scytonema sp. UIC 10036]MUG98769.1 PAS domain-containing protein [Scytonema sp. UIC 10036]
MHDVLVNLFSSDLFIPHGHCYLWKPGLVWLHLISDSIIALAYYSIPLTLFYFVRKRQDLPFSWIFLLFAAFIISCGTTHIAEIWTLWHPTYWLSGIIKAGTAAVSLFTAIELVPLVPQALALPSPTQLAQANEALQAQIEERLQVENQLRRLQDELEQRVRVRTAELMKVNEQLQQEIDERHRAETALRASRERLVLAQQVGKIGTCEWNIQTGELIWTEEMEALFGLAPGSFEGSYEHWLKRLHPDDRPGADLAARRTATEGADFDTEFRIILPDGQIRWAAAKAKIFYDDGGKPDRLIGVNMDITTRKEVQQELQQTLQTLSTLIQASPLPIVLIELDMTVKLWNIAAEQLFGWSEAELLGQPLPFVPKEKLEECRQLREALTKGEVFFGVETYRRKRDGSNVVVNISAAPLYDERGSVNEILLILQDITERKRAEAEREQLLVREQAAREQAEAANRIKDEFLAVLSHELRSPLNPILGWAKLLQSRTLDEQKTKYALATIERNAQLQTQLIGDLLDVSRILQGKLSLNIAPVDLAATIKAAMETVCLAAEAKSIQIETAINTTIGKVTGDSGRIQQIIWNLLANAVKFTPEGGRVEICLERVGTQAQITVSDTGKGISPDFLPYVFDYFRQADSATTRKFGGLGLGLAIVRHLTELHGGLVTAHSLGEGKGATFTLRLPLMKKGAELENEPSSDSTNPELATSPLAGLRILVVDDEGDTREYISFVLEQAGANVISAESAERALQILVQFTPDILLSDIGMAEMDGYGLIRQVRAMPSEQGGEILAIALTAYAGEMNQQLALAAGFQQHISKPVEPEQLISAIVNLV